MARMMPSTLRCACAEPFTSREEGCAIGGGGLSALMIQSGTGASTSPCSTSNPQAGHQMAQPFVGLEQQMPSA